VFIKGFILIVMHVDDCFMFCLFGICFYCEHEIIPTVGKNFNLEQQNGGS